MEPEKGCNFAAEVFKERDMKTDMKRWAADIISQKRVAAVPVMTHPGIELTGHTVRQAVSDGRVHAEAVVRLAERWPSAAACTMMDLTVEAEAFGAEIAFSDEAVPSVASRLLTDVESIYELKVPQLSAGRIPQYLKASLLASEAIVDCPLLGGCIGPFSLAGRLYDMSEMMVLTCEHADAAHVLLQKCTDFIGKYCEALKMTGANGVLMAEPAAGLLSNEDCRVFSSQYVRQIVERVQDDDFMVVLHNCGNQGHCTKAMVETGAAAYHFGNKCSMEDVIADIPADALAMGNLDPVSLFKDGTPEQMREATLHLLERMRQYPNFVISSGCDTPPHTPIENVEAFFGACAKWNEAVGK